MKPGRNLVVLCVLILLVLLSGCKPAPEPIEELEVDLANMTESGISINVSGNTRVSIENLNLKDGIFLQAQSGRSLTDGNARTSGNSNLFQTQGGGFLLVPDSNHHGEFLGSEVNVSEKTAMLIRQFLNIDFDFKISSDEPKFANFNIGDVAEEYYYVDFLLDPRFRDLDSSRVVVVGPTYGGFSEYSIVQFGQYDRYKKGLLDFSPFPGFGIYLYRANGGNDSADWSSTCHVLTPTRVSAGFSAELENNLYVFDVAISDGSYYKLTVTYNSDDEVQSLVSGHFERYYDGSPRSAVAIPIIDNSANTVTYYFGKTDRPFLFNLDLSSFADNGSYSVSFDSTDESSFPGFIDIMKETRSGDFEIAVSDSTAGGYLTLPFTITESSYLQIEIDETYYLVGSFFQGEHGYGGFPTGINKFDDTTSTGYVVIDCRTFNSGDRLGMIHGTETPYVECRHMIWDKNSNMYVCADGTCNNTYIYADMFLLLWTSFTNKLETTVDGVNVEIKDCGATVNGFHMGSSENSHGTEEEFALLISSNNMDHNQRVQLTYKEFWTDENKLVTKLRGDLIINANGIHKEFEDVIFTSGSAPAVHNHSWQFSGNLATCPGCGKTRSCSSVQISSGMPSDITVSGLAEGKTLELIIPEADFTDTLTNGSVSYPALQMDAVAYILAEDSETQLSIQTPSDGVFLVTVN